GWSTVMANKRPDFRLTRMLRRTSLTRNMDIFSECSGMLPDRIGCFGYTNFLNSPQGSCQIGITILGRDQVPRSPRPEGVDVVEELVRETLDRLTARPGHVGGQNEIGTVHEAHEGMVGRRGLGRHHVEGGTRD